MAQSTGTSTIGRQTLLTSGGMGSINAIRGSIVDATGLYIGTKLGRWVIYELSVPVGAQAVATPKEVVSGEFYGDGFTQLFPAVGGAQPFGNYRLDVIWLKSGLTWYASFV